MKKLLLIAILSLFVAGAYAAELQMFGYYEMNGNFVSNNNLGDGGSKYQENADVANFDQTLVVYARFIVDPKVRITVRSYIMDGRILGREGPGGSYYGNTGGYGTGNVFLDRAWVAYDITEALTVELGRLTANDYTVGWASGLYDGTFEEMGGRDQIKATYKVSDEVSVYATYIHDYESSTQDPGEMGNVRGSNDNQANGRDNWGVVAGAKMDFNGLFVNPYISYYTYQANAYSRPPASLYSVYVDAGMAPAEGLNWTVALAYSGGMGDDGDKGIAEINGFKAKDYSVYGAYLDVAFVQEAFTVGGLVAYSSFDEKNGWFTFGGDFDKTTIIDGYFGYEYGFPASTMFQLYADISLMEALSLGLSGSYYMSNVDKDNIVGYDTSYGTFMGIGKDSNAYEFDAELSYAFTESTTFSVGAAYAKFNDIYNTRSPDKYSPDGVTYFYWTVATEF